MGVRIVASFQLFKASVLVGVALLLHFSPQVVTGSEGLLYPLFYLAMRGNTPAMEAALRGGSLLPGIIGCLGLYVGCLGLGLLGMRRWARRSLLFTSGATVLLYAKSVLLASGTVAAGFAAQPTGMHVDALALLDTLVLVYFLRGATADSFRLCAQTFSNERMQRIS